MPSVKESRLRVFHGISGAAGQPSSIVKALGAEGIDAQNYLVGNNKFGFSADRLIAPGDHLNSTLFDLLTDELQAFDVFHFYFRPLFFDSTRNVYPMGLDLVLLKLMNKKIVMNFRGSEVRLHSVFSNKSPFHYVEEDPDGLVSRFPEEQQREQIELADAICDHILVPDPELQTYVPNAKIVPRAIDLQAWKPAPIEDHPIPLIVHAPSRRTVKGTDHILEAVRLLREEGLAFEFQLVEGLKNEEARDVYRRADIIVDQLRIGWYGVLAVEGMALGKAVVSYVRRDLLSHLGERPPIAIADPTNIAEVLRRLIVDQPFRRELGRRGRAFCEGTHDSRQVASKLSEIYHEAGKPIDHKALAEYFARQHSSHRDAELALNQQLSLKNREIVQLTARLESANRTLDEVRSKLAPLIWLRRHVRRLRR